MATTNEHGVGPRRDFPARSFAVALLLAASSAGLPAQDRPGRGLVDQYCLACHSRAAASGGLVLEGIPRRLPQLTRTFGEMPPGRHAASRHFGDSIVHSRIDCRVGRRRPARALRDPDRTKAGFHDRAMASFMTACEPTVGKLHVGISVDQIAALELGKQTQLASLEVSTEDNGAAIDLENEQGETPLDLTDHQERLQESLARQNAAGDPEGAEPFRSRLGRSLRQRRRASLTGSSVRTKIF